jgi:hypothetical protein
MSIGGVRIELSERESPVFGDTEFGTVGRYERLHGTVFGELDPTHPLNVGIVNLDPAARNARGNVEYRSDFRILKPVDLDRGNLCLVYDVPNRGNQPIMARLNGTPDGGHPQHAGNGFLMRRGFTVVWSGWQGDVSPGNDRLTARFPSITGITGVVSQSGRVLRDLVYLGFNQDLAGRRCSTASFPSSPGRAAPLSTGSLRRPAAIRASTRITPTATTSPRSAIRC